MIKGFCKFLFSTLFLIIFFIHDIIENKDLLKIKNSEISSKNIYDISSTIGEFFLAGTSYKIFVYNNYSNPLNIFSYNAVFIGGSIVVKIVKHFVKKERPDKSNFSSFPSGHSFMATVSLLFIIFGSIKRLSLNNAIFSIIGVIVWNFRILAERHYFEDVIGGVTIGILSFLIGMEISKYLYKKIKIPKILDFLN